MRRINPKSISLFIVGGVLLILGGFVVAHQVGWTPPPALATRILLPVFVNESTPAPGETRTPLVTPTMPGDATPTATATSRPDETPTATPTRLPTSTPLPTPDDSADPPREGLRPDERPDLAAGGIMLSPAYPMPGEPVEIRVDVRNVANAAVPNVEVLLLLDQEPIATQRIDVPAVSTAQMRTTWTPDSAGMVHLTAIIDPTGEILERNRADNTAARGAVVSAPVGEGVELAVTNLDRITPESGPSQVEVTIQNAGAAAGQAPLVLWTQNFSDTQLLDPIPAQESVTLNIPWPDSSAATTISAEINPRDKMNESNAADNMLVSAPAAAVDLTVKDLSISAAQVIPGEPRWVTISFRVVNVGNEDITTAFTTRIFPGAITGPERTPADLEPFILSSDGLARGQSLYGSRSLALPGNVNTFTARIEADVDDAVDEDDESNNVATLDFQNPTPDVDRWISIGPRRITDANSNGYAWNDATGRLSAIAIPPAQPNTLYVGAKGSGVWKTVDGGATWLPIADSLPTVTVAALALDPTDTDRLYMVSRAEGVYRSDDGGTSWQQRSDQDLQAIIHGGILLIDPDSPSRLYVASSDGVQRATDGGATWQNVLSGGSVTGLVMDPTNPSHVYAALLHQADSGVAGIYETTDAGQTWTELTGCPGGALPTDTAGAKITLALSQGTLFAGFRASDSFQLYRTTEIGCSVGGRLATVWETGWGTTSDHGVLWSGMWADPTDSDFLYLGGTYFWRSTDGGDNFTLTSGLGSPAGSAHVDHHGFAVDPQNPSTIYSANDGGIYRSTDRGRQGTWDFIGDGLAIVEFYDHAVAATEPELVIGGTQDNGTMKNQNDSLVWSMMRGGDGATVDIDPTDADTLYSMGQYAGSIARSTNGGDSFQNIAQGLPTGSVCFNLPWHLHPQTPTTLLAPCQGALWRTTSSDPPGAWQELFRPSSGGVTRSAVDGSVDLYYAGTNTGALYAGAGGANWQRVFENPSSSSSVSDIEVDRDRPTAMYVAFGHGSGAGRVFRLTRTGSAPTSMTGVDVTSDLPANRTVKALAVDRMNAFTIYAGTQKGVYRGRSLDDGATWFWRPYNNGMPAADVRDLEVHPTTGVMRAATHGRSAYEVNTDFPIGSILAADGTLTFLRVHDVGTGFGPPSDSIDGEVIIQLDTEPGKSFGFQLRTDENEHAHKAMLDLLRDAFGRDARVRVDYVRTGLRNGRILRVMVLS